MKLLLVLFLLFESLVLAEGQAHLVFYRVEEATPYHASIRIDGVVAHKLGKSHRWATDIDSGPHTLYGDRAQFGHDYTFEAGRTYYFRVSWRQGEHVGPFHRGENRTWGFRIVPTPEEVALGDTDGLQSDK